MANQNPHIPILHLFKLNPFLTNVSLLYPLKTSDVENCFKMGEDEVCYNGGSAVGTGMYVIFQNYRNISSSYIFLTF